MKETVEKLKGKLQVSYYLVGRVRTTEQFSGTPFNVIVKNIKPALIESTISFKIIDFQHYEMKYLLNGTESKNSGKFNEDFINEDFSINVKRESQFVRNTAAGLSLVNYQIVIHDLNNLVYNFQQNLKVVNPDYTNVLVLTLDDILPERAILVLDTLSKIYIGKSTQSRFEINDRTISFIDKQLEEVSSSLKEVEDTMQNFKKQKGILDLDWEKNDFFTKLASFDGQKSKLKLKIDAINDLEKYIIEDKDPEFLPPNVFLVDDDRFLTSSVTELYNLQIQLSTQLGYSKEVNPNVIEIRQKTKKLKQNILLYINNTRNATFKIIDNINGEVEKYVAEFKTIQPKQREISNIQRKVSVNEGLYTFLLQQRANKKIAKASIVPEIKIIDSPRNLGAVSPDKVKIISPEG